MVRKRMRSTIAHTAVRKPLDTVTAACGKALKKRIALCAGMLTSDDLVQNVVGMREPRPVRPLERRSERSTQRPPRLRTRNHVSVAVIAVSQTAVEMSQTMPTWSNLLKFV